MKVELGEGWWKGFKAHLAGWLGEIFCLVLMLELEPPAGEAWALRVSEDKLPENLGYGQLLSTFAGPGAGDFGDSSSLVRALARVMTPPFFRGLPHGLKGKVERLRVAWVPAEGGEGRVAEMLRPWLEWRLSIMPRPLNEYEPEALREAVVRARQSATGFASIVMETPSSDFAAFKLVDMALRGGDFVILKFEVRGVRAPPEVTARLHRARAGSKARWVVDVKPNRVVFTVKDALVQALRANKGEVYLSRGKIRIKRSVREEELASLLKEACHYAQLKLEKEQLHTSPKVLGGCLKGVEIVEVKTGTGRASEVQRGYQEVLRREAEAARGILGRELGVAYRVLRVGLHGFDVPRVAEVEAEKVEEL